MYKLNTYLQYPKRPSDGISPSKISMGLKDRLKASKGVGAAAAVAAKLGMSKLNTPWTMVPKNVRGAQAAAKRAAKSVLTGGASEIASGMKNTFKKLKFW